MWQRMAYNPHYVYDCSDARTTGQDKGCRPSFCVKVFWWGDVKKTLTSSVLWWSSDTEKLPAGTKPRTSHRRSPGGEKRRKRTRSAIFSEMTRKGHRQSDQHWNGFKGNIGETLERRGGAHMGFPERIDTILNWTELNSNDTTTLISCKGVLVKWLHANTIRTQR